MSNRTAIGVTVKMPAELYQRIENLRQKLETRAKGGKIQRGVILRAALAAGLDALENGERARAERAVLRGVERREGEVDASYGCVDCEHANENPSTCPCAPGCYCFSHTCFTRPVQSCTHPAWLPRR